jgi:hypothetical protein
LVFNIFFHKIHEASKYLQPLGAIWLGPTLRNMQTIFLGERFRQPMTTDPPFVMILVISNPLMYPNMKTLRLLAGESQKESNPSRAIPGNGSLKPAKNIRSKRVTSALEIPHAPGS